MDGISRGRNGVARSTGGSHRESQPKGAPSLAGRNGELREGKIDGIHRARFVERIEFDVADDSYHFADDARKERQGQMLADGVFIRPVAASAGIAAEANPCPPGLIRLDEIA